MTTNDSEFITLSQAMPLPRPDELDIDMDFLAEFENSMDVEEDESDEEDGMVEVVIPQAGSTEASLELDEIVEHSPITESFVTPAPVSQQEGTVLPSDTPAETHEDTLTPTRELSKNERRALATRAKKAAPPLPPVPAHLRSSHISALDVALGRRKQLDWMKTGQVTFLRDRETVAAPICQAPGRKRTRSITDRSAESAKKPRTLPPCFIAPAYQVRPLFYSSAAHTAGPSTGNVTFNAPTTSSSSNQSGNLPTPRPTYVDPYHRPIHDVAFTRNTLTLTDANLAAFTKKYKNLPADPKILAQIICADVPIITADTTVVCPQDHACVLLSDFERHVARYHRPPPGNSFNCWCNGSKTETFATASELVIHMRNSHLVETKFRCPHCPALIAPMEKNMRDHLLRSCHGMKTFK